MLPISAAPWTAAMFVLCTCFVPAQAQKGDAARGEVVKIGQVTGDDAFDAQVKVLLKDPKHAKVLVAAGVKMAEAKDSQLTFYGAMTLGQIAGDLKDYKSCETLYRVAMTQAVKLTSPKKVLQSYGNLIDILYDGKKYADSVRICRELLEIKTGDGKPRAYMFIVEDRFGDFGFEPDFDFDLAKPLKPAIHQLMIQGLAKDGKHEQALKLVDNLIQARDHWQQRQLRGWVLREMGNLPEAVKVYVDVLDRIAHDEDLTDKGKEVYGERYKHILSNVYIESKQIDKAVEILRELLKNHPNEPGFYNDLGYVMADNDMNLKESEELIRKALELDREARKKKPGYNAAQDKDRGAYLDSLGWVLYKLKRYDEAKKYLTEALQDKDSQHLEIFDHLGDTCLALGQKQAAVDAWRKGLEVAGDDRTEKERKAEVEKKIEKHK